MTINIDIVVVRVLNKLYKPWHYENVWNKLYTQWHYENEAAEWDFKYVKRLKFELSSLIDTHEFHNKQNIPLSDDDYKNILSGMARLLHHNLCVLKAHPWGRLKL